MSESFWFGVEEFFNMLDLDANEELDVDEAFIGLTVCYDAVHQINNRGSLDSMCTGSLQSSHSSLSEQHVKTQAIQKQVDWLFAATHHHDIHSNCERGISLQQFKSCYEKLLQSAYEEEVLTIDMQRGIKALRENEEFQLMQQLFKLVKQLYTAFQTNSLSISQLLNAAFTSFTSSQQHPLPPKKHNQALKLIGTLLNEAATRQVQLTEISSVYKKLLLLQLPCNILLTDLKTQVLLMNDS